MNSILLINLGTPKSPTEQDVRSYLKEFLNDPFVIDLPPLVRFLLLNLVILPKRPKESAKAYQAIWTKHGSPLMTNSINLKNKLQNLMQADYKIELAMRYGDPNIKSALQKLLANNPEKLIVLPLYPQYSTAATESSLQKVKQELKNFKTNAEIIYIRDFFDNKYFISAYADLITNNLTDFAYDKILFSFHGLPIRQLTKSGCTTAEKCNQTNNCDIGCVEPSNCYRASCYVSAKLIANACNIEPKKYQVSFQSRLGRIPWIKPYTDEVLISLREEGVNNLAIATPAFVADCLETLEEIGLRAKEQWQELGGKGFKLIPCLNDNPVWVQALSNLLINNQKSIAA